MENLKDVENSPNYTFVKGDIEDVDFLSALFQSHQFEGIIHLAAESHVDRSITNPLAFIRTNVLGTVNLLDAAVKHWKGNTQRFYHISTDEVFGSIEEPGLFTENTPYDPKSPYSASKASSDHFVRAYHNTYDLPILISNCSNNYGPCQFPEKLVPLCINNIKESSPVPVYGQGLNIRDWLYVEDHAAAIDLIYHKGLVGETYNIGGGSPCKNIDLVRSICRIMDEKLNRPIGQSESLITFVKDRAGHDLRYAIDSKKIIEDLKWQTTTTLEEGLRTTVAWYLENDSWLDHVTSGHYKNYYHLQYNKR